ncbi:AAA family ATPase [Geoalkalibacter halelectricus]|uniref:bifunctional aminoglycoside phosphotransferase/ATP-binding protein n=1 Tax=Geoalkalibacter halelectricus TaxID=2847045 RepID=UPI003D2441A1
MTSEMVHQALMKPQAYPDAPEKVEFTETHVSRLYFTRNFVYKVKKPVDFGFLNFTTLDRRRFYCEEEVRLNRRFCPDTYLGIKEIRRDSGGIHLNGQGEILDYAVWMKRLPAARMLDHLIEARSPELEAVMPALGALLARIEEQAQICRENSGMSNLDEVRRNWRENFDQIAPFVGRTLVAPTLDLCRRYVDGFLQANAALLLQREADGYVRDGHGDLHAEHICLTDPVRIYDCIEFNRRFRVADIAADLAFLLMDLEVRGRRDLAAALLEGYVNSAAPDPELGTLLPFYKIYRAFVRGKVESFLSADDSAAESVRSAARRRARHYFNLVLGYLMQPCLILTCGLMGSGKSTLARALAHSTGAQILRSDAIRKELAADAAKNSPHHDFGAGIYSSEWTRRTYDSLLQSAAAGLGRGAMLIVDASFADAQQRRLFMNLAQKIGRPCFVLHLRSDTATLEQRLRRRSAEQTDISDGRVELLAAHQRAFSAPQADPWVVEIDATADIDENVEYALGEIIQRAGFL